MRLGEVILWKPLYIVSIGMFALFMITLFFSPIFAMIILFSLISLWSRMIPMLIPLGREIDVIDFFVLIIAINLGAWPAAIFGVFNMAFSRLFGPLENIHYTIKDTIAYFFGAFLLPVIFLATGSLLWTIFSFVALRFFVRFLITLLFDRDCALEEIGVIIVSAPIALILNGILVGIFGPITMKLLSGISFSFEIFVIASLIMLAPIVLTLLKRKIVKTEKYTDFV